MIHKSIPASNNKISVSFQMSQVPPALYCNSLTRNKHRRKEDQLLCRALLVILVVLGFFRLYYVQYMGDSARDGHGSSRTDRPSRGP